MKTKILPIIALSAAMTLFSTSAVRAQGLALNTTGSAAAASAMLDVTSTTRGVLIPRMTTTQMNAISSPATGLMVYNTTTGSFYYYTGSVWQAVGAGGSGTVTSVSSGNLTPVFSTSVSNATTTPSISYSLSNSAAYTVLTNSTNATSAPSYGKVVPNALFASSGTASSSTFYRGDGSWATAGGGYAFSYFASLGSSSSINNYTEFLGAFSGANGNGSTPAPVTTAFNIVPVDMVLDAFYVSPVIRATYASGAVNVYTGTVYKNGSPTSMTVTVTTGTSNSVGTVLTTVRDVIHTVTLAAGDKVSIQWAQTSSIGGELANMFVGFHAN